MQFAEDEDEARRLREWRRWQFNLVAYTIMTILGIGVLLPWNVAINAYVDAAIGRSDCAAVPLTYRFDFFDDYYGTKFNFWLSGAYVWPQVAILLLMIKVRPTCELLCWS